MQFIKKPPNQHLMNKSKLNRLIIDGKKYMIILTGVVWLLMAGSCQNQKFGFHENNEGVLLTYDNQKIFFYQEKTKSLNGEYPRANYIHPLYGLNGEVLTEDFPEDHLHHRGIFWAWHQVYIKDQRVGDGWECKGITWDVTHVETHASMDSAWMIAQVIWKGSLPESSTDSLTDLIHEKTVISCYRRSEDQLEIRFDIRLKALYDGSMLGGSEDIKGYSGFSIRTRLPEDLAFYSAGGRVTPLETAIEAGGWIDMEGTFDPDAQRQTSLTLMCDPDDPNPFHGWILRDKGSMQNAAFPGTTPVLIPKGEILGMQYEIFLHRPDLGREEIESVYKGFIESKN